MTLQDALAIIEVHGHGHYLSDARQELLHDARVVVVKYVQEFERERAKAEAHS